MVTFNEGYGKSRTEPYNPVAPLIGPSPNDTVVSNRAFLGADLLRRAQVAAGTIDCMGAQGETPPGPGEVVRAIADPLALLVELRTEYGDVVRFRNAHRTVYLVSSPEGVRDVLHNPVFERTKVVSLALGDGLLASDGELWRQQRRLIGPLLRNESMPAFADVMQDTIGALVERWHHHASTGAQVDVFAEMTELSLRIVLRTLFGTDGGAAVPDVIAAVRRVVADLGVLSATVFGVPAVVSAEHSRRFKEALATIHSFAAELIAQGGDDPTLQHLLRESDPQLARDEIVSMLVAGHETTSVMLAWTWRLLADSPHVEATLAAHLDDVLQGEAPTVDRLDELDYARMVLCESLRLYPPVWCMVRNATEPARVAGYTLPGDAMVALSAWSTHRDPTIWPVPDRFDPERFTKAAEKNRHAYSFFPFGGGRHLCAGDQFALTEGMLLLAATAGRFRIRPIASTSEAAELAITLRPAGGVPATIQLASRR